MKYLYHKKTSNSSKFVYFEFNQNTNPSTFDLSKIIYFILKIGVWFINLNIGETI